jgi:MSHA pilin protein MshC
MPKNDGFTLVELVTTIILISILSVTMVPRIFDREDVAPQAFQSRMIAVLRNLQMRALSDTREFSGQDYPCFRMNFDNVNNAFGPPPLTYYDDSNPSDTGILEDTCETYIDTTVNPDNFYATSSELSAENVDLRALNSDGNAISYMEFSSQGLPVPESGDCLLDSSSGKNGCYIELCNDDCTTLGTAKSYVCIESQGYIHGSQCGT